MPAEPPESTVTEGGRTLEVRWIFPGRLEAAVAGWFRAIAATSYVVVRGGEGTRTLFSAYPRGL
jgi:hypothetical protein